MKRAMFDQMKSSYMDLLHESPDEALSGGAACPAKQARGKSATQTAFIHAMRARMSELEETGVPGPDRMRTAAAEWHAHQRLV